MVHTLSESESPRDCASARTAAEAFKLMSCFCFVSCLVVANIFLDDHWHDGSHVDRWDGYSVDIRLQQVSAIIAALLRCALYP